jgi:hypothetical protein
VRGPRTAPAARLDLERDALVGDLEHALRAVEEAESWPRKSVMRPNAYTSTSMSSTTLASWSHWAGV